MQILKLLLSLWYIFLNIVKTRKFSFLEWVGQIFDNGQIYLGLWSPTSIRLNNNVFGLFFPAMKKIIEKENKQIQQTQNPEV